MLHKKIVINGIDTESDCETLEELLAARNIAAPYVGIAVAVNFQVVARQAIPTQPICEGDTIDIVGAVQGG